MNFDTLSLEGMIRQGRYGRIDSNINARNFSGDALKVNRNTLLIHPKRQLSSKVVQERLESDNRTGAKLGSLLYHGFRNPNDQESFPILALGSTIELAGRLFVPCLYMDMGNRALLLKKVDGTWPSEYRFLAELAAAQNSAAA